MDSSGLPQPAASERFPVLPPTSSTPPPPSHSLPPGVNPIPHFGMWPPTNCSEVARGEQRTTTSTAYQLQNPKIMKPCQNVHDDRVASSSICMLPNCQYQHHLQQHGRVMPAAPATSTYVQQLPSGHHDKKEHQAYMIGYQVPARPTVHPQPVVQPCHPHQHHHHSHPPLSSSTQIPGVSSGPVMATQMRSVVMGHHYPATTSGYGQPPPTNAPAGYYQTTPGPQGTTLPYVDYNHYNHPGHGGMSVAAAAAAMQYAQQNQHHHQQQRQGTGGLLPGSSNFHQNGPPKVLNPAQAYQQAYQQYQQYIQHQQQSMYHHHAGHPQQTPSAVMHPRIMTVPLKQTFMTQCPANQIHQQPPPPQPYPTTSVVPQPGKTVTITHTESYGRDCCKNACGEPVPMKVTPTSSTATSGEPPLKSGDKEVSEKSSKLKTSSSVTKLKIRERKPRLVVGKKEKSVTVTGGGGSSKKLRYSIKSCTGISSRIRCISSKLAVLPPSPSMESEWSTSSKPTKPVVVLSQEDFPPIESPYKSEAVVVDSTREPEPASQPSTSPEICPFSNSSSSSDVEFGFSPRAVVTEEMEDSLRLECGCSCAELRAMAGIKPPPGFEHLIRPAFPLEQYDPSLLGHLMQAQLPKETVALIDGVRLDDVKALLATIKDRPRIVSDIDGIHEASWSEVEEEEADSDWSTLDKAIKTALDDWMEELESRNFCRF